MKVFYIILVLSSMASSVYASVIYVDKDNDSGNEDGLSWSTAFVEIQDGIDAAIAGDEVWVGAGVYDEVRISLLYSPLTDTGSLLLKANVALYGGFLGIETAKAERDWKKWVTVVEGVTARSGLPAYQVVYGAENARIDGFTIRGGKSDDAPIIPAGTGAGIRCEFDGMTIENCVITRNIGNGIGGISVFGTVSLINSDILNNINGGFHGDNTSTIIGCKFKGNSSRFNGGGILISLGFGETALIEDCVFDGNEADFEGGAIRGTGEIIIKRCVFKINQAREGGALWLAGNPIQIRNSIFWKNTAAGEGGAIFALGRDDPFDFEMQTSMTIFNSTFAGNTAGGTGGIRADGGLVLVRNSLFWKNSEPEASWTFPHMMGIVYSLIDTVPEDVFLENVVTGNPLFVDATTGDLRIWGDSPAVDSGSDNGGFTGYDPPMDDIIGTVRPLGAGWDVGAYEFDPDNPPVLPEGSGDSTCFVATAAFGTPLAGEIDVLRGVRDDSLLTNPVGSAFTDTYYRLSPPVADFVARHGWAKGVVRVGLGVVIGLMQMGWVFSMLIAFIAFGFLARRARAIWMW